MFDPDEDAARRRTTATTGRARSRPAASSTRLPEPRPWLNRTTTPPKPTISPTSRLRVIASSDRASDAMTIVNSGVVAWRIAASDESMYCSPQVISVNGITMLTTAMNRSFGVRRPLARQGRPDDEQRRPRTAIRRTAGRR